MHLTGVLRLGRDMEVRYLPDGTPVGSINGAFNYGKKDAEGNRPTQWVSVTVWGERAEKISDMMTKGQQIFVVLDEPHIETYTKQDGSTGTALRARLNSFQFVGGKRELTESEKQHSTAKGNGFAPEGGSGFEDMEDDIPF